MTIDIIKRTLSERFAEELPDDYKRRIIFWHDSEREFESMIDEVVIPDVKILKLTGDNFFAVKMLLLETDTESNYLIYSPLSYKHREDNWLRDIERYSEEFRADLTSMQMDELHIPQITQIRRAMKHYTKFFESKERTTKLASLKTKYENAGQLHIDIMAVLSNAEVNTVHGVLRAILCDTLDEEENQALANIQKFGSQEALYEMIARYTGYADEKFSLWGLTAHIMITALSGGLEPSLFSGLNQYISEGNQSNCYAFLDEWAHSKDSEKLFEIAEEVQGHFNLVKRLETLDTNILLKSDSLPCIDECIIERFMNEISENVIKIPDILKAVESRRVSKWHEKFSYFYDGLYAIAKMQEFHLEHIAGFHYGEYSQLWKMYCSELYLMDTYYREHHIAFRKSLKNASSELDDLFKNVSETAEKIYQWYLSELNQQWCMLIREDMELSGRLHKLKQQTNFYKDKVKPILQKGGRVFVIISDALRYEVASELTEKLIRETNGTAEISAMQSVFPSITKFGMSALLPHHELTLTENLKMLCDGNSTEGTENRDKILKQIHHKNCAVTYEALLSMKQTQRRELVSGAETVYIYHNKIDAIGDKAVTEHQVSEACQDTIEELKTLVKLIVNSLSGSNIIITADHGFLYSHELLTESDKAEKSLVSGNIMESCRRYILADAGSQSNVLMKISMSPYQSEIIGLTPFETIRIRQQGGGEHFVHGGISLQECCVPVITFKNIRAGSKKFVDIKKVELTLLSMTRKISNNIFTLDFFQKDAVEGKKVPATYELYFCDELSKKVSDVQTIIADKTTEPQHRVYKARFTLRGESFDENAPYFLNIVDKETGAVIEKTQFSIKIAFANDFDF